MTRFGAASTSAWEFAQLERFWERFSPLTPWGKDEKAARSVLADLPAIEALYDGTETALRLLARLEGESAALDRLNWHLRRLPRFPLDKPERNSSYDIVEIFQVKKFLANYRALLAIAGGECAAFFGFAFTSQGLASALDLGGSDAESFYVADAYDERLHELRKRIAAVDTAIAACRAEAARVALERWKLDFDGRDFLILPHKAARGMSLDRSFLAIEAYDDSSFVVRLQQGQDELDLAAERDILEESERGVENAVLVRLSAMIAGELESLSRYADAVCAFDLALARASLAKSLGLTRPILSAAVKGGAVAPIVLRGGSYLPCAWECEALGLRYTPLDFELAEAGAVIFGSNMGGKTVVLESIVFMQVLAQAGFFLPALFFSAPVCTLVHYVGDATSGRRGKAAIASPKGGTGMAPADDSATGEGLSGFGFEIWSFVEAWKDSRDGALVVFDEFARTTSSYEAEAILSAVVEALVSRPGTHCLFSTHFRGVARLPGVRYLRVRGLDRAAARGAICAEGELLQERIRRINGMMEYGLVDDSGPSPRRSDAIAIASLLGLDCGIVTRAEGIYTARSREME